MPVKSFECAIARSQIGRYLAGDTLGDESMRQLEGHISVCADCQRLIDSKKEELLGPLAHAPTAEEAIAQEATVEEALATSTDVAAIERELRAAAARSGRAVIEVETAEVPAIEIRELVGAATGGSAAAIAASGATNSAAPSMPATASNLSAPSLTVMTNEFSSGSAPRSSMSKSSLSGLGAALGRLSLPKLVRDVPDADPIEPAPFGPMPLSPEIPVAEATPARRSFTKPAILAGALVLVLGAMAVLGDPTALLGGKVATPEKIKSKFAAGSPAKGSAKAKTAKVARATGVRHSALGVPITDAVAPATKSVAKPAAKVAMKSAATPHAALVAKATPAHDAADLGPLEFDPTLDAPKPAARIAPKPAAKVKPATAKTAAKRPTANPAPVLAEATAVAAPVRASRPAHKRRVVKPVKRVRKAGAKSARKPAAAQNVIRVYDETGKPIN